MSKGILMYALNNEQIDYTEIAVYAAKQAKKHLNVPIALVTDSFDWLIKQFPNYKDYFDILIKVVHQSDIGNFNPNYQYPVGSLVYYEHSIWKKIAEGLDYIQPLRLDYIQPLRGKTTSDSYQFNTDDFEHIYQGIDIVKWYPNLPYLVGQHVWHESNLYRCEIQYQEGESFSLDKYILLIENIKDGDIEVTDVTKGDHFLYNRSLWMSKIDFKSKINGIISILDMSNFTREYSGIDIDKWYPNLPYLVGQHVWHENKLYRCREEYNEGLDFSKEKYDIVLENVKDGDIEVTHVTKGDHFLYNRSLWMSKIDFKSKINGIISILDMSNFTREYSGIDIDKWYPNLPYLVGQHVWHENKLYRCREEYNEGLDFSKEKYDIVLENIKDLSVTKKLSKGDLLLHERSVWLSNIDFNLDKESLPINTKVWENTDERQLVYSSSPQYRRYFDGAMSFRRLKFKNDMRVKSFELSPFDETLVIDCDYLINNDILKYCWQQSHDFLIYKNSVDLSGFRYDPRLVTLSDKSIDFYWATVFYFRKNKNTEIFFNLLSHIQDNWNYYRYVYQIEHSLYRNDFAFSIAIHIMNGYQTGYWTHELPGTLYYTIDKDILLKHNKEQMTILVEKEKYKGEYTLIKTKGINVHVMNKFSLARIIREHANE